MLEAYAQAVQASALSQTLRASIWLYPLVNTGHLLGIGLLFGAIVPLDLRLTGCWRSVPLAPLVRVLVPVAIAGLVLAIATGVLLFATRPVDYVAEPLFIAKFVLLAAAVGNALLLRRLPQWRWIEVDHADRQPIPVRWKLAAALSIGLWLGVITIGRLIGYR